MSEYARKYWRLVGTEGWAIVDLEYLRLEEKHYHQWGAVAKTIRNIWVLREEADKHLLNSLIANKERFADGELDWSGLSPETCEALRGLGVDIPEEGVCDLCGGKGEYAAWTPCPDCHYYGEEPIHEA